MEYYHSTNTTENVMGFSQGLREPDAEVLEWGLDELDAPEEIDRAPGDGGWAVPHYQTFSQLINRVSRTYRWTHDEALLHSRKNARAMRRDPVIMDALRARQMPVVQLPWHIEAPNPQDSKQAEAVDLLTEIINGTPRFQDYLRQLLEAVFFGRYGIQERFGWDWSDGTRRMKIVDHRPIHGDKLVFKYDGRAGVLTHVTFPGTVEVTDRGRAHIFSPHEREQVVIHTHEPEDADWYEGHLAGGVQGVGIRGRLYWFWFLRQQVLGFLLDYLERVGAGGLTIYYYQAGDRASLNEVKNAAEKQDGNTAILFPRYRDGGNGGPGVQRVEASNAGANLLQNLVMSYFDQVMVHYILGQTLSSTSAATGLGSGVADLHGDTFTRIVKYDAVALGDTLSDQLVRVLQKYNCPGCKAPLRFVFDIDSPNAVEIAEAAKMFYEMGGTVSENQLREVLGLETPQPGESMLAKMGSMSPLGMMPQGVPMQGQPGMPMDLMAGGGMPMAGMPPTPMPGMPPGPIPMQRRRRRKYRPQTS